MRKTRSLIGKTLLAALILLIISAPFLTPASAVYIEEIPTPTIYMDPFRVQGNAGDTVIVYLRIKDVQPNLDPLPDGPLLSFQAGLLFDPTKVNCSAVEEGGFLSSNGTDTLLYFPGTIDNVNGNISMYGWSLTVPPESPKSGSGILMKFTFHMEVTGYSDVHVTDFVPISTDGVTEMLVKTVDYFTAVVGGGQYVVKIVGNPEGRLAQFSAHSVTAINRDIGGTIYKGQMNFSIASRDTFTGFNFFNVTIPRALMSSAQGEWYVTVDNSVQGGRIVTENTTHFFIYLEFSFGSEPTAAIGILSTFIVPEFSSVFFATLLILATFAAALFGKATWSYKRKG